MVNAQWLHKVLIGLKSVQGPLAKMRIRHFRQNEDFEPCTKISGSCVLPPKMPGSSSDMRPILDYQILLKILAAVF